MCETARSELIATIVAAFGEMQREDGVSLHEADALNNYGVEEDPARARAVDTEHHWWEVPDAHMERLYWAHSYFDAKGFRYYLPAYMTWALRVLPEPNANTTSLDSLLYTLTPSEEPPESNWLFQKQVALLTSEQCKAICSFLQYLVRYGDGYGEMAQEALNRYWCKFLVVEA
jgi:hypothetical protein